MLGILTSRHLPVRCQKDDRCIVLVQEITLYCVPLHFHEILASYKYIQDISNAYQIQLTEPFPIDIIAPVYSLESQCTPRKDPSTNPIILARFLHPSSHSQEENECLDILPCSLTEKKELGDRSVELLGHLLTEDFPLFVILYVEQVVPRGTHLGTP